jgi:hypothetical protein
MHILAAWCCECCAAGRRPCDPSSNCSGCDLRCAAEPSLNSHATAGVAGLRRRCDSPCHGGLSQRCGQFDAGSEQATAAAAVVKRAAADVTLPPAHTMPLRSLQRQPPPSPKLNQLETNTRATVHTHAREGVHRMRPPAPRTPPPLRAASITHTAPTAARYTPAQHTPMLAATEHQS